MIVGNTLVRKLASSLIFYEYSPPKNLVDYCLVKRDQKTFLKDIKVLCSWRVQNPDKPMICDFKIQKVKDTRRLNMKTVLRLISANISTSKERLV